LSFSLLTYTCEGNLAVVLENNVRECRKQHNLTQEDMADALDISRQTIIAIENMKYNPSLELALKIGKLFNKPIEEIFFYQ
jgi:putative transcriptional regulator